MFGWLKKKKEQRKEEEWRDELDCFVAMLKEHGEHEMATLALRAMSAGDMLNDNREAFGLNPGGDLLNPRDYYGLDSDIIMKLERVIGVASHEDMEGMGGGILPWLYSYRAVAMPGLHPAACAMWAEMARGFSRLELLDEVSPAVDSLSQSKAAIPEGFVIYGTFPA